MTNSSSKVESLRYKKPDEDDDTGALTKGLEALVHNQYFETVMGSSLSFLR